ncbi:hypothetical protein [Nonomuraea sp. NPDC049709]|uniref:hypothetical protein n=1 Tax=Nonomuraea sp. NPDC049709 TaxID=3154736 RepID=UPI003422F19A
MLDVFGALAQYVARWLQEERRRFRTPKTTDGDIARAANVHESLRTKLAIGNARRFLTGGR